MMSDIFFKCILLNRGSENTAELESETLPYLFNTQISLQVWSLPITPT